MNTKRNQKAHYEITYKKANGAWVEKIQAVSAASDDEAFDKLLAKYPSLKSAMRRKDLEA